MFETIKDLGAIVGIASFIGFVVLLVLYIQRAREIRALRRSAPFLAEGKNGRPSEPRRQAAARTQRKSSGT